MPLGSRRTLILIAVYIAFAAAMAVWLDYEGRELAIQLINNTARLIGREVTAVVSAPAIEQLVQKDGETRQRLQQVVDDLTEHSEVIDSIDIVDESGKIVASDDPADEGTEADLPRELIEGTEKIEFPVTHNASALGTYHLFVPLLREGKAVGYLRLSLNSRSIARLHYRTRRQFLLVAFLGLVGMGVLGTLFHFQVSRRTDALAQALEHAMRGETQPPAPKNDVFSKAFDAARRVGEQLSHEREKRSQAHLRLNAMMRAMDTGLLLLQPNKDLDFANAPARELLGYGAPGELETHWAQLKQRLVPGHAAAPGDADGLTFDLDLPREGVVRKLRLEIYQIAEADYAGYLVLVKNRESMEALENELGLAIQMRGLVRFHMAFVHDLRAPLNAMVMNVELLKQTLRNGGGGDEATHERQLRYIGVLKEEISRVDRQLGTLLTHSAPPGDTREELDVTQLIRELAALLGPMAHHQRVALETHLPPVPIRLTVQRDRLKQAMLNIAINALEAMPEGGKLTIDVEPHGDTVRVGFRDTGPGIPPEVLSDIYNMHFTTKAGGTGIGLYVARAVAEAHGGEIRVEDSSGGGTCLGIYLPRSDQELPV
jgi:signal transduction histidine kinase/uncharacterized membrane protein affecting hemolysin expression